MAEGHLWTIHDRTALAQPATTPRLHHRPSGVNEHIEVESSELSEPPTSQPPVGRDIEVDWTCAVAFTPTY